MNYYLALKKAIWKGIRPILKPLFKSLSKIFKSQADFFKDFVLTPVTFEVEYYLAIAPLCPELFNKKVPKLINKVSDPSIKKSISKILKTSTSSGLDSGKIDREFNRNRRHLLSQNLPKSLSQKEVLKSHFSGLNISEADQVLLEDKKTTISREEALNWLECTKLSGLGTGYTLNLMS